MENPEIGVDSEKLLLSDSQRKLIDKINQSANIINQKHRQGDSNYIIVNSEIATVIENMETDLKEKEINDNRLEKLNKILDEQLTKN